MGTRSLTHIHDGGIEAPILATVYVQFDGYPTGVGRDIFNALKGRQLVNGYSNADQINGMGNLAAILIFALKEDGSAGGAYLYPPGSKDCGEEYTYDVYNILPEGEDNGPSWMRIDQGKIGLRVTENYKDTVIYDGPIDDFDAEQIEAALREDDD